MIVLRIYQNWFLVNMLLWGDDVSWRLRMWSSSWGGNDTHELRTNLSKCHSYKSLWGNGKETFNIAYSWWDTGAGNDSRWLGSTQDQNRCKLANFPNFGFSKTISHEFFFQIFALNALIQRRFRRIFNSRRVKLGLGLPRKPPQIPTHRERVHHQSRLASTTHSPSIVQNAIHIQPLLWRKRRTKKKPTSNILKCK